MKNTNRKKISILGSALTLGLTACGSNSASISTNINVDNAVEITSTIGTSVTLGASLEDYFNGKVTKVTETCNNTEEDNPPAVISELDTSIVTTPPIETTVTTTKITTVTTPFNYYWDYDIYSYAYVNVNDSLNVRAEPSKNSSKVSSLKPNQEIFVESMYYNSKGEYWCHIVSPCNGYVLSSYIIFCGGDKEKPVIYLYPQIETKVSVKLELNGRFTYTYPTYNDGWNVTAYPDGKIVDVNGREYSYLFWEGMGAMNYDFSTGFVVERANVTEFLYDKLTYMGLKTNEVNEFLVYWSPRLMKNEYSLVSFQWKEYEDYAKLYISPKPDSILRVFMVFKPVDSDFKIAPQKLPTLKRTGFTVVEWGGSELGSNVQV